MTAEESIGQILSDIAALAIADAGGAPDGVFLYAEAESQVVSPALFKELPERVLSSGGSGELTYRILDAWHAAPDDHKWNALFLTIEGDQFDARFQYAEDWKGEEFGFDRLARVVSAKFGSKPIEYEPFDSLTDGVAWMASMVAGARPQP